MRVVRFYRVGEGLGSLSNFSPHAVVLPERWSPAQGMPAGNGGAAVTWSTTEHYFQAQKFVDQPEPVRCIQLAPSPGGAAAIGRDRSWILRSDWEGVKDRVMLTAIEAKAAQHDDVREALLATGEDWIVEHTKNDWYWADGGNDTGLNMLGRLWMAVRNRLQAQLPGHEVDRRRFPPWIAHPEHPRYDIAWESGDGEAHLLKWEAWYQALSSAEQRSYRMRFPAPPGDWDGYWEAQHPWLARRPSDAPSRTTPAQRRN